MPLPRLLWDIGTAYDLFVSQKVLHRPAEYGLRGAWAAGVRARLPVEERETLEQARSLLWETPLHWIHGLPEPKDAATALWVMGRVPPSDRLAALALSPKVPRELSEVLHNVAARRIWDERDRESLETYARLKGEECVFSPSAVTTILDAWSHAAEFGERYLQALRAYHEAFFAEEERRIQPALELSLARAQELAERLALPDLVEELSQGLRFVELPAAAELVLAPSFWGTPFLFFGETSAGRAIWLFGAKPANASLVPGEVVPDALLRSLKALSDPTRLRILHYLAAEPLTAAELARLLRLRAPTVAHHLQALRLAGLVQVTVAEIEGKDRDVYAARSEAVEAAFASLRGFLEQDKGEKTTL